MPKRGKWVALEGVDGVGKTTLFLALMRRWYGKNFISVADEKLPTTLVKKQVVMFREVLWSDYYPDAPTRVRYFLHRAFRDKYMFNYLEAGRWILSDRSWLSNYVYAPEQDRPLIQEFETALITPDCYLIIDGGRREKGDDPDDQVLARAKDGYEQILVDPSPLAGGVAIRFSKVGGVDETLDMLEEVLRWEGFPIPTDERRSS